MIVNHYTKAYDLSSSPNWPVGIENDDTDDHKGAVAIMQPIFLSKYRNETKEKAVWLRPNVMIDIHQYFCCIWITNHLTSADNTQWKVV